MSQNWTPSQLSAIEIKDKTLLVSAAAGSGKTTVLTERIIRSLTDAEHPADLSRLLVVTFTRAAAADLKAKISKALNKALAEHPENEPFPTGSLTALAKALDIGRASLYRALDKLENEGTILRDGRRITVLSTDDLLKQYQ